MIVGFDDKISFFKKLIEKDNLFHAYLFFGEPQIGKFQFAVSLANYLEKNIFEPPTNKEILEETLIISPDEKLSIGIDAVRFATHFLLQKPVFSKKRVLIIRDANVLTAEAQNAILKIIEEPPIDSLIIFVVSDKEIILPTLLSRFQSIYFPRLSSDKIEKFLADNFSKEPKEKLKKIILESCGRIGKAIEIINDKNYEKNKKFLKDIDIGDVDKIVGGDLDKFFEALAVDLRRDLYKNIDALRQLLKTITAIKMFNVNKKLQIRNLILNLNGQNKINSK